MSNSMRIPLASRLRLLPLPLRALLVFVALLVLLALFYVAAKLSVNTFRLWQVWYGQQLNQEAWEAGYRERGLPVPPGGPRDGYWGAKLGAHVEHPELGWVLPPVQVLELLDIDERGMQHRSASHDAKAHLLIMGASTAFGSYASTIDNTYFALLGSLLEANEIPIDITVFATGAWKSVQEIKALDRAGMEVRPDVVLFLNGLNDVTNGSNAQTLFGEPTETLDGSRWHLLYHEHDYAQRVRGYTDNMRKARDRLIRDGVAVVFVLQPALFEKRPLSIIEEGLEARSLEPLGSREELLKAYAAMRRQLIGLAKIEAAHFVDASRVFSGEKATIFTDLWHFSDPGHRILAEHLARALEPVLRALVEKPRETDPS